MAAGAARLLLSSDLDCYAIDATLYSIEAGAHWLNTVDPFTGMTMLVDDEDDPPIFERIAITLAGQTVFGGNGLAVDPSTDTLWALLRISANPAASARLVTINPATGVATSRGTLSGRFVGIAFDIKGRLFGVTGETAAPLLPESIYRITTDGFADTALFSERGDGDNGEAIAYNPTDGLIYHASGRGAFNDPINGQIFESISPNPDLSETEITLSGDLYEQITAITSVRTGSIFLFADFEDDFFFISPTGEVEFIGTMDHHSNGLALLDRADGVATIRVAVDMKNPGIEVVGGQFSFIYDKSALTFVRADPVDLGKRLPDNPFEEQIHEAHDPNFSADFGKVRYAVGVDGAPFGTSNDMTLAILTFESGIGQEVCLETSGLVQFLEDDPGFPMILLANDGGEPVGPLTEDDLGPIRIDVTPPTFGVTCPADIPLTGGCPVDASWDLPRATVDCVGIISLTSTHDPGDSFDEGVTTVIYTVADTCGNVGRCSFNIEVTCNLVVGLLVELKGAIVTANPGPATTLTRCIDFEVFPAGGGPAVLRSKEVEFDTLTGQPVRGIAEITVPPGNYVCITAQDTLHTLKRRTDLGPGDPGQGTDIQANFIDPPGEEDKSLVGGDLNDDGLVDILDFGIKVGQFGTDFNPDTNPQGGEFTDTFGFAVAIDGDVAVIGVPGDDDRRNSTVGGVDSGSAYVFRFNPETDVWEFEAKLRPHTDRAPLDLFGFSVAVDGDVIVVGAPNDDDACGGNPDCDSGSAWVFRLDPTAGNSLPRWIEEQKLLASAGRLGDQFGFSVGVSGDVIVVGAPEGDSDETDVGTAYVFEFDGALTQWFFEEKIFANDDVFEGFFGWTVDVDGGTILVGAPLNDGDVLNDFDGAAYIFRKNAGAWSQQTKLTDGDGGNFDAFGNAVSIDGTGALIGAPGDNNERGSAYFFRNTGGNNWCPESKVISDPIAVSDHFGEAVSLDGFDAVIGAHNANAAYVFRKDTGVNCTDDWEQLAKLTDVTVVFELGFAVGISDGMVVTSAAGHQLAGMVPFFAEPDTGWADTATPHTRAVAPGSLTTCSSIFWHADINGDGFVDDFDYEDFIQENFAFVDDPATECVAAMSAGFGDFDPPAPPPPPLWRVSVPQLIDMRLKELIAADLNKDGWLDLVDVALFDVGVRP